MMKRMISMFWIGWGLLFLVTVAWGQLLPDTGQTTCYDASGNILDSCPSPGEPFYGQDANYAINTPSYTKLDDSGSPLPESAYYWAMVKDNVSGLIWEVKRNRDGSPNYNDPQDADNSYTWCDTNPSTNGGNQGLCEEYNTRGFIDDLNASNYGGYKDWRMPTYEEMQSIVDFGQYGPAVNTSFFPNAVSLGYWSSTSYAASPTSALLIDFNYGNSGIVGKGYYHHVRAVRGGQAMPAFRYVDNANGTVTDTETGLMWQQDTAQGAMTWQEALSYCEELSLAGFKDWRLPNIKELSSLMDRGRYNPSINTAFFPNTEVSYYWSSTTHTHTPSLAWILDLYDGREYDRYKSYYNYIHYVRAVRGGKAVQEQAPVIAQTPMSGPPETMFMQWGTGFTPNSTAIMHVQKPDGTEYPEQNIPIDGAGNFEIEYTVPKDREPGIYIWWMVDGPTGIKSNEVSYEVTENQVQQRRYYALLVSVNKYPKGIQDWKFGRQNTIKLKNALLKYSNWEEGNIYTLNNTAATKENIKSYISYIKQQMNSDDLFLFYFNGHGSQAEGHEYLATYDNKDDRLRDDEFKELLEELKIPNMVAIIQSCHSGGVAEDIATLPNVVALASVSKNQKTAANTFSEYVIESINTSTDSISVKEIYDYVLTKPKKIRGVNIWDIIGEPKLYPPGYADSSDDLIIGIK